MTMTKKQLEAAALLRTAEGKAPIVRKADGTYGEGAKPLRREQEKAQFALSESVAYGDLPTQLRPTLARRLQKVYDNTPAQAEKFTRLWELSGLDRDEEYDVYQFDQANLAKLNKQGTAFVPGGLPTLGQQEPYPQIGTSGSGKYGRARKVGEAFGINWEAVVNLRGRNVNIINDGLEEMGRHARNQGEIDVAQLLVTSTGFATATGQGLNGATALTANPDLYNPDSITAAINQLANVTVQGTYPVYDKYYILTAPANVGAIRRAVGARNLVRNPGVTAGPSWSEQIDFGAEIEVIGWRWLQRIWSGIGKGAIIVPVANGDDLPVLTRNRLEGFTEPQLFIKDSNSRSASGTPFDVESNGDFDSDAIMTKVRFATGASSLWSAGIGFTTGANA